MIPHEPRAPTSSTEWYTRQGQLPTWNALCVQPVQVLRRVGVAPGPVSANWITAYYLAGGVVPPGVDLSLVR